MLCCKKNRKFINDTVLLTKKQILHKFHKILCLENWGFLMQKWCRGIAKDSSESLGLQGDQTSQSVNPKGNQSWIFIGRPDAEAKGPIFGHLMWRTDSLEKTWCWERLKAGEGDDKGWDGWMALPTQWTWVRASSRSWWLTGKPGVLQSMGSQRVGHNWATELTERKSTGTILSKKNLKVSAMI